MALPKSPVLQYRSGVPSSRRARLARIAMLVLAALALEAAAVLILHPAFQVHGIQQWMGGGVMGTPFSPINGALSDDEIQRQYLPRALLYLAIFLLTQWFFLCPRGSWRIKRSENGPPPLKAAIAAGFIGMLLGIGLLATLMEIPDWWIAWTAPGEITRGQRFGSLHGRQHYGSIWILMGMIWIAWTIAFQIYWQSLDRYTALRRVFRWLVAGTVLEMVIAAPVHAWVVYRRGGDCYCARGSWTGIAFGCTAALWLFGPGAFLLMWREKKRFETVTMAGVESTPLGASPAPSAESTSGDPTL